MAEWRFYRCLREKQVPENMTTPVGMLGFLVLVGATVVAGGHFGPDDRSFEDLVEFVTGLENDLNAANSDLSNIATLSAAIDERFNLINDRRVPSLKLRNSQQSDLVEQLEKQTSGLGDRADTARAHVARAAETASQTEVVLSRQRNNALSRNMDRNERQAEDISTLGTTISDLEQGLLRNISDTLTNLTRRSESSAAMILGLQDFVDARKCEHGTASIKAGETFVPFLTTFTETPSVALVINGFFAELDKSSYSKSDRLMVNRKVKYVNTDGFTVNAEDLSDGVAAVNDVFVRYMACQFLDRDVDIVITYD